MAESSDAEAQRVLAEMVRLKTCRCGSLTPDESTDLLPESVARERKVLAQPSRGAGLKRSSVGACSMPRESPPILCPSCGGNAFLLSSGDIGPSAKVNFRLCPGGRNKRARAIDPILLAR